MIRLLSPVRKVLVGNVRRFVTLSMFLSLISLTPSASARSEVGEKLVMGWLETVFLQPMNIQATAKLDTGAKTSSVHASKIEHFNQGGTPWVRFEFVASKGKDAIKIERPLVRKAVIKERLSRSSTREVVMLSICKNGKEYVTEFTLNDRSNFNYPILLGRSFLAGVALVDSADTFLFKVDGDPCGGKVSGLNP
jgi:hypothetical protein